jgi:hypothetical protein
VSLSARIAIRRFTLVTLLASVGASDRLWRNGWEGRQTATQIPLPQNTNRPTVSNPAHVTQYGVLELEYGLDRQWPQEGFRQTSSGGLLKIRIALRH